MSSALPCPAERAGIRPDACTCPRAASFRSYFPSNTTKSLTVVKTFSGYFVAKTAVGIAVRSARTTMIAKQKFAGGNHVFARQQAGTPLSAHRRRNRTLRDPRGRETHPDHRRGNLGRRSRRRVVQPD